MTQENVHGLLKSVFFNPPWVAERDGGFNIGNLYFIDRPIGGRLRLQRADYVGPDDQNPQPLECPDDFEMVDIAVGDTIEELLVKLAGDYGRIRMQDEIKYQGNKRG